MPASLLWYDLETFGADPASDRIVQLACQRTDHELRPIAAPINLRVRTPWYYLPEPEACLVTGLAPRVDAADLSEDALADLIETEFGRPETTSAGYNCIRFDDEFLRHLLWRQLRDPYAREWQHGNRRFDLLDLARMCYALRPEGIEWPRREDGLPSFRLEDLAVANALPQAQAHDALSDVQATLALAALLRQRQPRLFAWGLGMSDKAQARALLQRGEPIVHVSGRYSARQGCLRLVWPLGSHPEQRNRFAVYDLMQDPQQWAEMTPEQLAEALYRPRSGTANVPGASPDDEAPRPGLKFVHVGRCPMLAPQGVLAQADCARIELDPQRCRRHAERLAADSALQQRLLEALSRRPQQADAAATGAEGGDTPQPRDAELSLYQDFVSRADRQRLDAFRIHPEAGLPGFDDARLTELAWRWQHADADPTDPHWQTLLQTRMQQGFGRKAPYAEWRQRVETLLQQQPQRRDLLQALLAWGDSAAARLGS